MGVEEGMKNGVMDGEKQGERFGEQGREIMGKGEADKRERNG